MYREERTDIMEPYFVEKYYDKLKDIFENGTKDAEG